MRLNFGSKKKPLRHLIFAGETHIGLVRDVNEDCFCYIDYPGDINSLAAVADGIGGHQGGGIASTLCCRGLVAAWKKLRAGQFRSTEKIIDFLRDQMIRMNNDIHAQNCRKKLSQPMGTTLIAAVFTPSRVVVAHAGDSRLYCHSNGRLLRLTEDHSLISDLVKKRVISEHEAPNHPFSHVISKSVGPTHPLEPEVNIYHRAPGAKFLMCSDGLTYQVPDEEIAAIMKSQPTAKSALNQLMKTALIKGGEDNITIICAF